VVAVGWALAICPTYRQPATTRDGFDRRGRQRFACHPCHRDLTHTSSGAFSGYPWPPDVIVTAVRMPRVVGRQKSLRPDQINFCPPTAQ
jgi:transposase-like protein